MEEISLQDLHNLISEGNKELKSEIQELKTKIIIEVEELREKNNKLENENRELKDKIQTIEKRQRKYNLIVHGVEESDDSLPETILELIKKVLKLDCDLTNFRDIYRLGHKSPNKIRPVLIETNNYSFKSKIFEQAKVNFQELKLKKIYISQDYTGEELEKRKFLYSHLKAAREKKYSAYIKNNILVVNGEEFSYAKLKSIDSLPEDLDTIQEPSESQNSQIFRSLPNSPRQNSFEFKGFNVTEKPEEKKRKLEISPQKSSDFKQKKNTRSQYKK